MATIIHTQVTSSMNQNIEISTSHSPTSLSMTGSPRLTSGGASARAISPLIPVRPGITRER